MRLGVTNIPFWWYQVPYLVLDVSSDKPFLQRTIFCLYGYHDRSDHRNQTYWDQTVQDSFEQGGLIAND